VRRWECWKELFSEEAVRETESLQISHFDVEVYHPGVCINYCNKWNCCFIFISVF
jgi:hypothetical protein